MEQLVVSSRRTSFGLIFGAVLAAFGFWLRYRAIGAASEATGNFDFSRMIGNATSMARDTEVGLFLIVLGGLVLLMSFWRWLNSA